MTAATQFNPIFVHASPRSGSTYFFNVLRRNDSLMCFNEAIIDVFSYWGKKGTEDTWKRLKWDTNHHFLDRHDYSEIIEAWDSVMHLCPLFPSFRDYLPADGVLPADLRDYLAGLMQYACSRNKRPALCEILSRGRAGALRSAFGGFHIAQLRDPLSQFGSFYRQLPQAGEWYFLVFPALELGIAGHHPLYAIVPEQWRLPVMPWPADSPAQRWATKIEYLAMVASPRAETLEKIFRWHLFSWFLSNLAAICYSDFVLDIDRIHDDVEYRSTVIETFESAIEVELDLHDLDNFARYYEFESFDMAAVCEQVTAAIEAAMRDGRVDAAVRVLGQQEPSIAPAHAVQLLVAKIESSLSAMATGARRRVTDDEWRSVAGKHKILWFNPRLRQAARRVYPVAEPLVRAARRAGFWR